MNIQYQLAKAYLDKLYRQGLITFGEMEQIDREMRRCYDRPENDTTDKIA